MNSIDIRRRRDIIQYIISNTVRWSLVDYNFRLPFNYFFQQDIVESKSCHINIGLSICHQFADGMLFPSFHCICRAIKFCMMQSRFYSYFICLMVPQILAEEGYNLILYIEQFKM